MRKLYLLVLAGALCCGACFAAGNSRITLNDGTTIFGKIVGMNDGFYSIHTDAMGDIKVNSDNVREITYGDSGSNNSNSRQMNILDGSSKRSNNNNSGNYGSGNNYSQQQQDITTKVQSMMMNENFLENLMQLGSSPEMQNILNDEEIMNAISSGDYDFLMNSSKMGDLMNSSGIQDILNDLQ